MTNNRKSNTTQSARLATVLIAIVLLAGCSTENCNGFDVNKANKALTDKGKIRVSIDGSGSMLGFTKPQGSEFNTVLEELDSLLGVKHALSIQNSDTKIFRIGRQPNGKISDEQISSLLTARNAAFYDGSSKEWPAVSSSIDRFATPDLNSIDILISDLEPDQSAIQQLISSIKPKLFNSKSRKSWFGTKNSVSKPVELALIGIQSRFTGSVFPSVADQFPAFQYNGIRPFYLLVLGDTTTVERMISQLAKIPEISDKIQITRFAANPDSGYTVFASRDSTLISPSCIIPTFAINKGFGGKIRFDNSDHWILAKASRQCPTNMKISISFKGSDSVGFNLADNSGAKPFGNSGMIQSFSLTNIGYTIVANPQVQADSLTNFQLPLENAEADPIVWRDWSTTSSTPIGSRTQRLLQLIRRIRSETDNYSLQNYGVKYSTLRMCSVVKT